MKELVIIQHQLVAKKSQQNNFGKYKYRSAEDILESVKPLLKDNNCVLTLTDDLKLIGDRYYIKATATITNLEKEAVEVSAFAREASEQRGMSEGQITGSTSSYARKYALNGLLAIAENDDLDSNEEDPAKQQVKRATPSKATDDDKAEAWSEFTTICQNLDVIAKEFLEQDVDMADRKAVYAEVRRWLQNEKLLRDQLISYKNQ